MSEDLYKLHTSQLPGNTPKALKTSSVNNSPLFSKTPRRSPTKYTPSRTPAYKLSAKSARKTTPKTQTYHDPEADKENTPSSVSSISGKTNASPITPYFLKPEKLVTRTCPPKQSNKGLFDSATKSKSSLQRRLQMAKRRSEMFPRPRDVLGSPLRNSETIGEFDE